MDRSSITHSFVTDLYVVEHEHGLHHVRSDPRGLALAVRELETMGVEAKIHMELREEGDKAHFEVMAMDGKKSALTSLLCTQKRQPG